MTAANQNSWFSWVWRVFPIKIQFISRFYKRPSFFKFNTPFIQHWHSYFKFNTPFIQPWHLFFNFNISFYLTLTFVFFSSPTFVYWRRFTCFYSRVTFVSSLSFVFHLTSFVLKKQMTKSSRLNKTNVKLNNERCAWKKRMLNLENNCQG